MANTIKLTRVVEEIEELSIVYAKDLITGHSIYIGESVACQNDRNICVFRHTVCWVGRYNSNTIKVKYLVGTNVYTAYYDEYAPIIIKVR